METKSIRQALTPLSNPLKFIFDALVIVAGAHKFPDFLMNGVQYTNTGRLRRSAIVV